jgi:hypothetical protein
MTRTRIIQRCTRVKSFFFAGHQRVFFLLLRQRRGAAATTWHYDQVPAKKQRAAPRASAWAHKDSSRYIRAKFTLFRCTSAEFFISCCDSVSALRQRPAHHDQVPAKNNERAAVIGLGITVNYPRRTTGAAAGSGLGTMPNYLCGAAGDGRAQRLSSFDAQRAPPRATAWAPRLMSTALRCTTSAAARKGLGTTIKYLQRTTSTL